MFHTNRKRPPKHQHLRNHSHLTLEGDLGLLADMLKVGFAYRNGAEWGGVRSLSTFSSFCLLLFPSTFSTSWNSFHFLISTKGWEWRVTEYSKGLSRYHNSCTTTVLWNTYALTQPSATHLTTLFRCPLGATMLVARDKKMNEIPFLPSKWYPTCLLNMQRALRWCCWGA